MKLSRLLKFVKPSQAISRANWLKITDVSGTISAPIISVRSEKILSKDVRLLD
jgi:hypothetical protein